MDAKSRQQFDSQFLPESFAATIVFFFKTKKLQVVSENAHFGQGYSANFPK